MPFFSLFPGTKKVSIRALALSIRCISLSEACLICRASKELLVITKYPLYFMHGILIFELKLDLNSS